MNQPINQSPKDLLELVTASKPLAAEGFTKMLGRSICASGVLKKIFTALAIFWEQKQLQLLTFPALLEPIVVRP